jgi:ATPase family associated with various cellular activities (AAA)
MPKILLQNLIGRVDSIRICGLGDRPRDNVEAGDTGSAGQDLFANWGGNGFGSKAPSLPFWQVRPVVHVYRCKGDGGREKLGANVGNDGDNDDNETDDDMLFGADMPDQSGSSNCDEPAPDCYTVIHLPARELDQVWESLILDSAIKSYLLSYIGSGCLFSQRDVSSRLVAWNRVALLHGPPGSGKTSLSRALAHKLAIRLDTSDARLLEIHANSLFSKWFSESSRNVAALFAKIHVLAGKCDLVVVLIDEIESLSASRAASASGAEPTDTLRVVNALLTALDKLRALPNVLVLATSNLTDHIDTAFLDRADVKQYIGLPSLGARYEILRSGVNELIRCGVVRRALRDDEEGDGTGSIGIGCTITSGEGSTVRGNHSGESGGVDEGMLYTLRDVPGSISAMMADRAAAASERERAWAIRKIGATGPSRGNGGAGNVGGLGSWEAENNSAEALLVRAADAAEGLSGRALRKLCLLAHAAFIRDTTACVPLARFLSALRRAAIAENCTRRILAGTDAHVH